MCEVVERCMRSGRVCEFCGGGNGREGFGCAVVNTVDVPTTGLDDGGFGEW